MSPSTSDVANSLSWTFGVKETRLYFGLVRASWLAANSSVPDAIKQPSKKLLKLKV